MSLEPWEVLFARRAVFVGASLWMFFHVAAVVGGVFLAGDADPLIALLVFDAVGLVVAALLWIARRIFPDKEARG